jgi:hypothetical protein
MNLIIILKSNVFHRIKREMVKVGVVPVAVAVAVAVMETMAAEE